LPAARYSRAFSDAERHQRPAPSEARSARDGRGKGGVVAHQMIGRQHEQHRIVTVGPLRAKRGERNGRGRIAPEGLEQERPPHWPDAAELGIGVLRVEVVVAVGDGHDLGDIGQRKRARRGLREQGLAVGQRHRRLRRRLARQWPKARAGAAGEDDGNDA
jgi:hypothetical protein